MYPSITVLHPVESDLTTLPPAVMQGLADAIPGAKHVSIPGAAHICNIQNPSGFNAALGGFLRGLPK